MRYALKKDSNQLEIIQALREIPGVSVYVHSYAPFDVTIGWRGTNRAYEIKSSKKARLTEAQDNFHKRWSGHWKRVESVDEILIDLGIKLRSKAC